MEGMDGKVEAKKWEIGKRVGEKTIPPSFIWHFKRCLQQRWLKLSYEYANEIYLTSSLLDVLF